MDLGGKVSIVTGAGTGIGRSVAIALAERGSRVVVHYSRSEEGARRTCAEIEGKGGEALLAQGDVSVDASCRRAVEATLARWNRIDVLVNNAGTTTFVPRNNLEELTDENWDRIFAVNVKGAFYMARAAAAALRATKQGVIVNVSSVAGLAGGGSSIPYAASKAALNNLTISLAGALAPEVRVNAIAPGYVETDRLAGFGDKLDSIRRHVQRSTPLGRVAQPEDVAEAILSMITGMGFMTGQTLLLDGGLARA